MLLSAGDSGALEDGGGMASSFPDPAVDGSVLFFVLGPTG